MNHPNPIYRSLPLILALSLLSAVAPAQEMEPIMPGYDADGHLLLPDDFREWVFVGSSIGLSYSEGSGGMEMFHHTLMEPTAYRHFTRRGEFREGTMFVLLLHGMGEGELPQRRGNFSTAIGGVEMAVKDSRTFDDGWAYFGFGGADGLRKSAEAFRGNSCNGCHSEHAAYDNVFMQFYPVLAAAAPAGSPVRLAMYGDDEAMEDEAVEEGEEDEEAEVRVALKGLDPIHLAEGREEKGKPEIVADHRGYRYQFVSEPSRVLFAADPERYSIQNDTCLMVPGAPVNADLYAVHDGYIYGFASPTCVEDFKAEPEGYASPRVVQAKAED